MTEEELREIEVRANAASRLTLYKDLQASISFEQNAFYLNCHTDVPNLVAEVRYLRAAMEMSRKDCNYDYIGCALNGTWEPKNGC